MNGNNKNRKHKRMKMICARAYGENGKNCDGEKFAKDIFPIFAQTTKKKRSKTLAWCDAAAYGEWK